MRPEQRADEAIKAAQALINLAAPTAASIHEDFIIAIASAIRQAENDALERAAEEIEMRQPATQDGISSRIVEACEILAGAVRQLKHEK